MSSKLPSVRLPFARLGPRAARPSSKVQPAAASTGAADGDPHEPGPAANGPQLLPRPRGTASRIRLLRLLGLLLLVHGSACRRGRVGPLRVPPPPSFFDTSPIKVTAFAQDSGIRHHILAMPFGEAAARLHSLHFESRTQFAFNQGAGRSYSQSDRAQVHHDSNGNVHVTLATPAAQVEMLTADDRVFVRYDTGQLRQKTRRDVDVDELPEKAFAGLSQVLNLFAQVAFVEARADTVGGRAATRYTLRNDSSAAPEAPAAVPSSGVRLPAAPPGRWREEAKPLALAGTLAVDDATGVVVQAEVDGRIEIKDPVVHTAILTVHHSHTVTDAGRASNVRPPGRFVAEFRRPTRPKDPLAFFRDQLAGGAPAAAAPENHADDLPARPGAPPPSGED